VNSWNSVRIDYHCSLSFQQMLASQLPSTWDCNFIRWVVMQSVLYVLTLIEVTADNGHKKHMLKMSFFQEVVLALICRNFLEYSSDQDLQPCSIPYKESSMKQTTNFLQKMFLLLESLRSKKLSHLHVNLCKFGFYELQKLGEVHVTKEYHGTLISKWLSSTLCQKVCQIDHMFWKQIRWPCFK